MSKTMIKNKIKSFFTAYRIGTILFTLFTLIYWYDFNISPEPNIFTFLLLWIYALPAIVLLGKISNTASLSEAVSYSILANISSVILFAVIGKKNQAVSASNLLNTTNLFILLTIWFIQLNVDLSFIHSMLLKGLIIGLFATLLVFVNHKKHIAEMVDGFKEEEKTEVPNVREGL
jgi:hypothetical protein